VYWFDALIDCFHAWRHTGLNSTHAKFCRLNLYGADRSTFLLRITSAITPSFVRLPILTGYSLLQFNASSCGPECLILIMFSSLDCSVLVPSWFLLISPLCYRVRQWRSSHCCMLTGKLVIPRPACTASCWYFRSIFLLRQPNERCVEGRLKGHFHRNTCPAENCSFLNPWNSASLTQPCLL
jgi:hypothetical protein